MSEVSLKNINKIYPNGFHAVHDFSLDIKNGEFIVLVGPSGCGKSTTLRMIAGLEGISSGDLIIDNERVNSLAPVDRDIAMVFQNYALYPNLTVYDNMGISLKIKHEEKNLIHESVKDAAEVLNLTNFLNRYPKNLSGGQRQRVAIGRTVVRNPKVFLMDEPLSNLDAKLRDKTRGEIVKLQHDLGVTTIYVTHDQKEAMTMADRIVIMSMGYVQQIGTPKELFETPENLFVAGFIGTPPMNFADGIVSEDGLYFVESSGIKLKLTAHQQEILKPYIGKAVKMASRAEYIYVDEFTMQKETSVVFEIDVDYSEFLGAYTLVYGKFGNSDVIAKIVNRRFVDGLKIKACFDMEKVHFFDVETTKRIR